MVEELIVLLGMSFFFEVRTTYLPSTCASVVFGRTVYNFTILMANAFVRSRRGNIGRKAEEGKLAVSELWN
jgi:hypothetical protein